MEEAPRRLIVPVRVQGFFQLDGQLYRNKFTRNMGYIIDGLLRRVNVTVYDSGGTSRTAYTSYGGLLYSASTTNNMGSPLHFIYGTGVTTPSVTDNWLASADATTRNPNHYNDSIEESTETRLLVAGRWAPDASKTLSEAGLGLIVDGYNGYVTLLARSVLSPSITRTAYTEYYDGYVLRFPASFTRWFVRALLAATAGYRYFVCRSTVVTAADGSPLVLQSNNTFAGTVDVRIGSDNTSPSPTHTNLLSPIASLSSQSQTVEVDTVLQEVRIVRTGTYTPSTNVTLGEIGLFASLNGYRAGSTASALTMVCRVALDTPVTLNAGTTYTLGIALVFS
ncbi:MAG: hypothetical protein QXU62_05360 [Thermofilaceae archaeon]